MAGRPKITRRMTSVPIISGFYPYGKLVKKDTSPILIHYEEYESLRLCDYEKYNQSDAAEIMEISRPTFTRIYISVREKIAQAFVEGKSMKIEGGKVCFDNEWYRCTKCGSVFNNSNNEEIFSCPLCGSEEFESVDQPALANEFKPRKRLGNRNMSAMNKVRNAENIAVKGVSRGIGHGNGRGNGRGNNNL
ncbi:MAG: Zn-ribbon containing protein [Bacteroidales bacterium]